jgi:multiple sugar transport system substrate-binding protein
MRPSGAGGEMLREQSNAGGVAAFGEKSLSRRTFMKLGGAGLAGVVLLGASGCGGESEGPGDLVFADLPDPGVVPNLIKKFNEKNKGKFEVILRVMPQDRQEYFEKLTTEFEVRGGVIDVTGADTIWTAELAENEWIAAVSDRFSERERSKFLSGPLQSLAYEGKMYGVPWKMDAGMLYYRKDLLEKGGFSDPPKTWDELRDMAEKVVRDSGTRFGFVFQGANYEGGVCNGLEFIWTHGGEVLDPNDSSKVIIDSPESVAGITAEQGMVSDGVAPEGVANYTELESETTFLKGDAVFCRNWPYMYGMTTMSDVSSIQPEQVGVAPLPVGEGQSHAVSCLGGWNLLINASSEMKDEAWDFVRFITNEESQKMRTPFNSPTLKTLYDDPEVLEPMPVIALGKEALQNARPRPVSPYYSEMSSKMAEQFNSVLRGAISAEEAVKTLQIELRQIIEQGQ